MEALPALSIIIVNYQSVWFAEQAICSINSSSLTHQVQIIVVNNDVGERCTAQLSPLSPCVTVIENIANTGFAQACNLGLKHATAPVVLFLNPDTLLGTQTLETCLQYLEEHQEVGALGVRMIDGSGNYLPESKRGLPTLSASFFKLSGFYRLFPNHPYINQYYAGDLQGKKTGPTSVLAGAFLMARLKLLHQIGGFDEAFFMYGEDIDLSYRITKAGFENHYLGEDATILHFKGESTSKTSPDYVQRFYGAMKLFVQKHYPAAVHVVYGWLIAAAKRLSTIKHQAIPEAIQSPHANGEIHLTVIGANHTYEAMLLTAFQQHYRQPINLRFITPKDSLPVKTTDLLFCPGADLPTEACFSRMQAHIGSYRYWFHLPGSHSIVGSIDSHSRGTILTL